MRWMFGLDDLNVFNVLYVLGDLDDLDVVTHIYSRFASLKMVLREEARSRTSETVCIIGLVDHSLC